tara:strand:- start:100 stop:1353 length:1254 start_codon:yes stop_codon:yes gene_type:complete
MSYTKNVVIRDLTIFGFEDNPIASLGKEIDTVMSIDYYECIFEPAFEFQILFQSAENALSSLKLRTTERVSLEIDHQTGPLKFDDLILTSFVQNESESTASSFVIRLQPASVIYNEQNKCTQPYNPTIKSSTHVENILRSNLKLSEDDYEIEQTANPDGFYGNRWKPFKAIYWLCRRAMSASMPEDGGGTDRVGFLFWRTKSKCKFKSIDTMISEGKSGSVFKYIQNDTISDNPNFDLYNPRDEYDQDVVRDLQSSRFGQNRGYVNLQTLAHMQPIPFTEEKAKQAHLGEDKLFRDFDINGKATTTTYSVINDFTMRKDGLVTSGEYEYHPERTVAQSKMRYESLLSKSLRITVPMNVELEAGDIISVDLIDSMKGTDEWRSGFYLIKDLRHTVHFRDNGVQCYTYLRLVKDTPGDD